MNTFLLFSAAGLISYLLGAVPFGFLIARARGVDIRTVGSGNIGATNVFRCLGKKWGILTFVCDVLKGFIPAFVLPVLFAPPDTVRETARAFLESMDGDPAHIVNLGHGILPETPVESVRALVETVKGWGG